MWSQSTYASRKGSALSAKSRAIRRSAYLSKRRQLPMLKAVYGKSIIVKLSKYESIAATIGGVTQLSAGLVNRLQGSNDWSNYAATYSLFNILAVKVHVLPSSITNMEGHTLIGGIVYDPKDSTVLAGYSSIADYLQYKFFTFGQNARSDYTFKFKPKPIGTIPQRVSDASETWGWVKTYSNDDQVESVAIYSICMRYTVCFAASE